MKYYFDFAATTPVDPKVVKAMAPYHSEIFGNPGSLHKFGQEASAAVFKARNKISKLINCDYREIIFTGSATEANNLALRGVIKRIMNNELGIKNKNAEGIIHNSQFIIPRVIVSSIEHESILKTAKDLEEMGIEVVYLPVSKNGIVDLKKLKESLNERTVLVSIMYVNNEVGTIQPIAKISGIIKDFRDELRIKNNELRKNSPFTIHNSLFPLLHTDAVQAFNYLDCDVKELGIDMMTLSSQKIYGPKGVGLLYARRIMNNELKIVNGERIIHNSPFYIHPLITGGGQEEGLRSGTENVAGIVGMAEAAQISFDSRKKESQRLLKLQDYFFKQIKKIYPKVLLNGPAIGEQRLPNNINLYPLTQRVGAGVYFPGKKDLIFKLDFAGFAVSGGSACSARMARPSHVLKALGCSDLKASESIRISFGRQTTKQEVDKLLAALRKVI
ncbi:MAG: cysteine desulfurase family protein [Patescibacteria group bacterium]